MIDWAKMTPREIAEELRHAPKVAGPWEKFGPGARRVQAIPGGGAPTACATKESGAAGAFETRAKADAYLRATGWLLVEDEATRRAKDEASP